MAIRTNLQNVTIGAFLDTTSRKFKFKTIKGAVVELSYDSKALLPFGVRHNDVVGSTRGFRSSAALRDYLLTI